MTHQAWRRALATAMVSALAGRSDVSGWKSIAAAVDEAALHDSDLRQAALQRSPAGAAADLVACLTAIRDGEYDRAIGLADACTVTARAIGEAGWAAVALALRVVAGADSEQAVEDLVASETALQHCLDEDLLWLGHLGLGFAYQTQRLFELAIVHQQAALDGPAAPFGLRASRLVPLLHLGTTHLHWADELEQLGDEANAAEIQDHRWLTTELAREAVAVGVSEGAQQAFVDEARVLQVSASWELDPAAAASALQVSVEASAFGCLLGSVDDRLARLAQVYAANGEPERAAECVHGALADPPSAQQARTNRPSAQQARTHQPSMRDSRAEARLRFVAVSLAARAGDDGSQAGLDYARIVARSWWADRIGRLHSVQRLLVSEDLARRNHRYRREAREDPLTGVANRRALDERLEAVRRSDGPVALVLVDVDDFKAINDTYGHTRGDEALREVAGLVSEHVRGRDLVARVGGDEFAVVLRSADDRQTGELVDRLGLAVLDGASASPHEHLQSIRLSFGWASTAEEGITADNLFEVADARMYADKRDKVGRAQTQATRATPRT